MQEYVNIWSAMSRDIRTLLSETGTRSVRSGPVELLAARAVPLLDALVAPDASVLLLGEPGSGKTYLAEFVVQQLETAQRGKVRTFVFPQPTIAAAAADSAHASSAHLGEGNQLKPVEAAAAEAFFSSVFPGLSGDSAETGDWLTDTFRAVRIAERILDLAIESAGDAEPLLLLPGVDHYSPHTAAVLEHLVRLRRVRIVATARRMEAGASQMARDPRTVRIPVSPLSLPESDLLLSALLGTGRIARGTLRRWHAATGGNAYELTLMLYANQRTGTLQQRQGIAQVSADRECLPEEFVRNLDDVCTPVERETIDMIALAEPMVETRLLRLLDPAATHSLLNRGLISSQALPDGRSALRVARPIVGTAMRAHMSPVRRIRLADRFFDALTGGHLGDAIAQHSHDLLRTVEFGLESGHTLPHDWLTGAIALLLVEANPRLMLRVTLALATEYDTVDAAAAALRALSHAVQLGDRHSAEAAYHRILEMLDTPELTAALPSVLHTRLRLAQTKQHFTQGASRADSLRELDEIERSLDPDDTLSIEVVRSARFSHLISDGDFVGAAEVMPQEGDVAADLVTEWVRAPARSASAVLLMQQGKIDAALRIAHQARRITVVGRRPLHDTIELQSFHWFLGFWASGSASGARRALEEIEAEASGTRNSGAWLSDLIGLGWAMLALQEGRWRDAVDLAELIDIRPPGDDPYGKGPLLDAVLALAFAALGEHDAAFAAQQRARVDRRGLSQTAAGFRRRLIVQTDAWLGAAVSDEARELAEWARQQGLGLIELEALHLIAAESQHGARSVRERARVLAAGVDPVVSEVILSHIEKVADGAVPNDVSEPEVRLLAELGLWAPLPRVADLSPREREIALFASLGYTSRFIAERFHLSPRTVETHLAHVYAKLGIADRGELRHWFSADRRVA